MTDSRAAFLCKLASSVPNDDKTTTLLKSYYLMRCRKRSKDHGMLQRDFSSKVSCSHCGNKWTKGNYTTKVRPLKLSKRQRQRIRALKQTNKNQEYIKTKQDLLQSNQLERICSLCKHTTVINLVKPNTTKYQSKVKKENSINAQNNLKNKTAKSNKTSNISCSGNSKNKICKKNIDVYSSSKEVFSIHNKNNSIITESPKEKPVKNNKRKRDKFAGLCKEAVLASAKLKKENESAGINKKLNIFLKPSS